MFVLEALCLTFATTPIVSFLYPPHLRSRATATGPSFANVRDPKDDESGTKDHSPSTKHDEDGVWKHRFTVILDKIEHLPSVMAITQLLHPPVPSHLRTERSSSSQGSRMEEEPTHFGALRLIELADRPSDVMKSSATDALLHTDPLLAIFRTFSELNGLAVSAALSIVPFDALATSVGEHVRAASAQLVLVPWLPSASTSTSTHASPDVADTSAAAAADHGPFDTLFRADRSTSLLHSHFVRGVFAHAGTNVALLVGRAPLGVREETHLFLPFFGGPDDRLALDFVVQLCANPRVRATVLRLNKRDVRAELAEPDAVHHDDKDMDTGKGKVELDTQTNMLTIASMRSVRFYSLFDAGFALLTNTARADERGFPGYDVRKRDDAHAHAVRDGRRRHLGALRPTPARIPQRGADGSGKRPRTDGRAVACDIRGTREPDAAASCGAACRYARARDHRPWALTPSCCRKPPCGAAYAGGGAWRGSRGREKDSGGCRNGVCDGWHQRQSLGDAGVWRPL